MAAVGKVNHERVVRALVFLLAYTFRAGILRNRSQPPVFIRRERGYFDKPRVRRLFVKAISLNIWGQDNPEWWCNSRKYGWLPWLGTVSSTCFDLI